ncbi:hypothetical protein PHMEG_00034863 [Phytophthora megakarya]|uniref:Uncharacterized protein n=1 Tax=Phytophthora megakarya TaxID=4795 RepID=A0A225UQE6_9STRA|nr:hypothetical protein PHMEG_00034863 [Phytophthora megakarya]
MDTRRRAAILRFLQDEEDSSEDDRDLQSATEYTQVLASRYFDRPSSYRRRGDRWKKLLYDTEYLNSTEFLEHFRMPLAANASTTPHARTCFVSPAFPSNYPPPFEQRCRTAVRSDSSFSTP